MSSDGKSSYFNQALAAKGTVQASIREGDYKAQSQLDHHLKPRQVSSAPKLVSDTSTSSPPPRE